MNLEQRLAAVEAELASLKSQQKTNEELAELVRKTAIETIKNAQRTGGVIHAAQKQTAVVFQRALIQSAKISNALIA